ncbi:hypothetical protein GQS52_23700 [Streptomyces sp. SCUT-3]|nr:hypothetical protein GQS52_23700 [Streptomyces sp. SCUT-3]
MRVPAGPGAAGAAAEAVEGVAGRMRDLGAGLPARDGVAVFNRVYLSVTEEVRALLSAGGFADPAAAAELVVRFAARYLAAVEEDGAGGRAAAGWRPLFRLRHHPGVHPVQFALAGINAHIGCDLAPAVVESCRALGCGPQALEAVYERVGGVLAGLEERVREELMPGPDLLDVADPLTHLVGAWSLERARDAAWAASRVLWGLRRRPVLAAEFTECADGAVGLVGRFLLTPPAPAQSSGSSTGAIVS